MQKHSLRALSANSLCLLSPFWMRVTPQRGGWKKLLAEVLETIGLGLGSHTLSMLL